MFAALSERPALFRDRLNIIICLAPVVTIHECGNWVMHTFRENETLAGLIKSNMGVEVCPNPQADNVLTSNFLKYTGMGEVTIKAFTDEDLEGLNLKGKETYFRHYPAGTSFNTVNHFRQIMNARQLQKYDHGLEKNLQIYN